jgi:hypothetical protein
LLAVVSLQGVRMSVERALVIGILVILFLIVLAYLL